MAFAVSEFKTNLKGGGARPSLFSVEFQYPDALQDSDSTKYIPLSKFLVKTASIPASTVGTYDLFFHGKAIKVVGDRTFDTWETTIINDEDYGIRIALEKWMDYVSDHKLNNRNKKLLSKEGENAPYKTTITVTQYSKSGQHMHHYHFLGAFPTGLGAIALDWGTQEIEEYTCTWTYDRWMPGTKPANSPVHHLLVSESHGN